MSWQTIGHAYSNRHHSLTLHVVMESTEGVLGLCTLKGAASTTKHAGKPREKLYSVNNGYITWSTLD